MMTAVTRDQNPTGAPWAPRALLIIAYCIALIAQLPFVSIPRDALRIGPFMVEGSQVITAVAGTVMVWAVMIWGLARRRHWGRVFCASCLRRAPATAHRGGVELASHVAS